ncbi:hypothetical protein HAHE_25600 [Haloferula helveola]|uniref:Uncharacterized protein n=1 Tax=Haloferula helveola TaxID=490095 RepID=A0ABM7RET4_9BACT|nr:hypothetical protein HAHE_25600 [Haloferula helveola]
MMRIHVLALFLVCAVPASAVEVSQSGNKVLIGNESFRLGYDLKSGAISGEDLKAGLTVFSSGQFTVDEMGWKQPEGATREWSATSIEDEFGKGRRLTVTETPNAGYRPIKSLHVRVYDGLPYAVLGFSVTNPHKIPARIARVGILEKAKFLPGKKMEDPKVLRGGAGAEPNRVESGLAIEAHNNILATGKVDGKRLSVVVGGLGYRDFLRFIQFDGQKNQLTVTIEDPQGKTVEPGATFDSADTVFLDFTTADPFESLERYGLAMRVANDAKPNAYDFPTLCGWLVSSGHYGEGKPINNSKDLVGQMDLAKESGILKYTPVAIRLEPDYYCNRNYGDTQQGWWDDEHWAKYGSLTPPFETFGKFCGKLHEMGGIPFTYIQSNMPSNDFAAAHPEWMLNNDISRLHAEHRHHMPFVKYDFTDPGFQEHTLAMWTRLGKDGLEGIKFDYPESAWCKDGGFEDTSYSTTNAYRKVFELCRAGLGPDAYIHERNLGEYGTPRLDVTAGIVDLQRVWGDSSHFEPEMASRMGLRWYKNRSVFGYYPDGKSFKGMDTDARRTMLSVVGLISGRLELGTSFGRMTPEEQHDLTRLFPVLRGTQSFRPVDMLLPDRKDPSVYCYRVDPDWSQVILCNNSEQPMKLRVPLSGDQSDTGSLGHDPDASYYVYDFWNDEFVGEVGGGQAIERALKPAQTLTYSVHRRVDHPQFLSTNRHILQGMLDLRDVKWDAATRTYSGVASVVGGEPFVITMAGNGMVPAEAKSSAGTATVAVGDDGLARLTLDAGEGGEVAWSITWEAGR